MLNSMKFKIITPERVVFSDEVDQVSLMTTEGEITVLSHHVPLVTLIKAGEVRYKKGNQELSMAVAGGFAEVRDGNELVILADTAEHAAEIDLARAEAAKAKAEKLMSEERKQEDVNYSALQVQLEKALNRLKVGNKYRKLP